MLSKYLQAFVILSLTLSGAHALNDWSKPCFDGECAYDLPDSSGASGIIKLFASPKAMTDITPAAGWVVLDCDPNVLEQEIRLVCETDHAESGCQNLFDHYGPVNKIVRLPESCGNGPFARISSMKVAEDQSLPAHAQGKLRRRDGAVPEVHVMTIDTNFALMDHAQSGDVKFAFVGATVPGLDLNEAFADWFWDDIAKWVSNAAQTVAKAVTTAVNWVGDRFKDLGSWIKDKTHFEIKPTVESSNISLKADVSLSQGSALPTCTGNGLHAKLNADVHSTGWFQVKAGIVIIGSVLPPAIDKLAAFGGINGEVDANLHLELALSGGFTFEKKIINDMGLPGLSIPGLITIGPYVSLAGRVQGHLELDLTADVHLAYVFDDLEVWYPKEQQNLSKEKGIKSKQSDLNLQASAHLNAKGFVQGTLIPQVHFGVSAIGGAASASIYVGAEAWVRATVQATADAHAKIGGKRDVATIERADDSASTNIPTNVNTYTTGDGVVRSIPPYSTQLRKLAARDASIGFSGCFWLDAGLLLKGGAEGHIFGWNAEAQFTIWKSPDWELFHKCWALGKASKPTSNAKPSWTIEQVGTLSKEKQVCSNHKDMAQRISDKVPSKSLK